MRDPPGKENGSYSEPWAQCLGRLTHKDIWGGGSPSWSPCIICIEGAALGDLRVQNESRKPFGQAPRPELQDGPIKSPLLFILTLHLPRSGGL